MKNLQLGVVMIDAYYNVKDNEAFTIQMQLDTGRLVCLMRVKQLDFK